MLKFVQIWLNNVQICLVLVNLYLVLSSSCKICLFISEKVRFDYSYSTLILLYTCLHCILTLVSSEPHEYILQIRQSFDNLMGILSHAKTAKNIIYSILPANNSIFPGWEDQIWKNICRTGSFKEHGSMHPAGYPRFYVVWNKSWAKKIWRL